MDTSKIKVPRHSASSPVERALRAKAKPDRQWHLLLEMAPSSAEQVARSYNVDGASWEFGYTVGPDDQGEVVSYLFARWVG